MDLEDLGGHQPRFDSKMLTEKRKPRPRPKTRPRVQAAVVGGAPPASSARRASRQNLKLGEWLAVFAHVDAHPTLSQQAVVEHFATLPSGPLVFTQSTLSRKLQERATLARRVHHAPSALDSKRPRIVTRPDVERALFLWARRTEAQGGPVDGPLMKAKRRRFEDLLDVPDDERLSGDGWLTSFRRAYKIRARRGRGNAAPSAVLPVDLPQRVAAENEVAKSIAELQRQDPISGTPLTVDESIEPKEEREGPDAILEDEAIVAEVVREMAEQRGEAITIDRDSDDDEESRCMPDISRDEAIDLCKRLTEACLQHADTNSDLAVGLLTHLRRFHAFLHQQELAHSGQTTLDDFFTPQNRRSSEPNT